MSAARPPARSDVPLGALLDLRRRLASQPELVDRAVERMRAAGVVVETLPTADALVERVLDVTPPDASVVYHPCVVGDALGLAEALTRAGRQVTILPHDLGEARPSGAWRERLLTASVGITGANAIVADTGSLLLAEELGFGRAASNVPPTHVALVTPDTVVGTLQDATEVARGYAAVHLGKPLPRYLSFITGPSKTADIGLHLVHGMHGPRTVHVLVWVHPKAAGADEASLGLWLRP